MKKLIFFILLIPNLSWAATYTIPTTRTYPWQGNVGVTYCKNTSYYTKATCEGAGSTWYTDIPTDRTQSGSTITASSGDRTSTIQTAINNAAANTFVLLGPGTFNITSLTLKSGVTLRGSGKTATILHFTNGSASYGIRFSSSSVSLGSSVNLSSGYTQGSTTIVTSSAHGWSAGDYVMFNQTANPSGDPPVTNNGLALDGKQPAHLIRIAAVPNSTTVTLDVPLAMTLDASKSPTGKKLSGTLTLGAGLENLKMDTLSVLNCCGSQGTLCLWGSSNSWIKNIEVEGIGRLTLSGQGVYRATIRSNDLHNNPPPRSPNYGYAFWVGPGFFCNSLVEDNAIYDNHSGYIINGPAVANVFGYNYATDLESAESSPNSNTQAIYWHGDEPMFNLWEGTHIDGATTGGDDDVYGGGAAYNTFFRNKLHYRTDHTQQMACYGAVNNRNVKHNVIGNILGLPGARYYEYSDLFSGVSMIYAWLPNVGGTSRSTLLRHANYDYYHNAQVWCTDAGEIGCQGGSSDHTLSNSLYLTSAPLWWCAESTWPPVNPAGGSEALRYSKIPAKIRYEGGTCTSGGGGGDSNNPTAPKNLEIRP